MKVDFTITGTLMLPEGSAFVPDRQNQIILPNGNVISVHPVIELSSSIDADDHHDIDSDEAADLEIEYDYDRTMEEVEEVKA